MKRCPFVTLEGHRLAPLVCLRGCGAKDEYCEKHLSQMDEVECALYEMSLLSHQGDNNNDGDC